MSFSPEFSTALHGACTNEGTPACDLRGAGATDADVLALAAVLCDEYDAELGEGGPPRAHAVLAIVALSLHTGARLERRRERPRTRRLLRRQQR